METAPIFEDIDVDTLQQKLEMFLHQIDGKECKKHLSKDGIEALYSFGFGFYEGGHFDKAMHFFRFLTLIDGKGRKHWMGLGACYQMLKDYERALQCYAYAAILNENDPLAHWHAAECFFSIDQIEPAQEALTSAEIVATKNAENYSALLGKIKLLKDKLSIKKEEGVAKLGGS